jgi:hypothetical protein
MSSLNELYANDDPGEARKALIATAILIALFVLLMFAPRHDPTKVAAGIPCSVLSESAIGSVLGTQYQLMPTSGTTCQYVATDSNTHRTLFVVARRDPNAPAALAGEEGTPVNGVGDAAVRVADALYVRSGSRWYGFIIVPHAAGAKSAYTDEIRLARLMSRTAVAQNR